MLKLTALAEEATKDHKRSLINFVSFLATTILPVGDANAANRVAQQPGFRGLIFGVFFPVSSYCQVTSCEGTADRKSPD